MYLSLLPDSVFLLVLVSLLLVLAIRAEKRRKRNYKREA